MDENFKNLSLRCLDTLEKTDLEEIKRILSTIKGPTICSGVGGSKVVSDYASLVIQAKNKIIANSVEPTTINHLNLSNYHNILLCSYSGNNYGTTLSFSNDLNKYVLSTNQIPNINNLTYTSSLPKEHSFISLAATLMPMSILLSYYLDNDYNIIKEILNEQVSFSIKPTLIYEIISSNLPGPIEEYLNSTLTESGIAIPIIHGRYGYCHGRTTISHHYNTSVIHIDENTELDRLLNCELPKYYQQVISLKSKYKDHIIDKFYLTYLAMYLTKSIAESVNKDLSSVEYSPLVKKLYRYKGEI